MKRYLYKQLLEWKASPNRKPLVLRGARQVGKTFLLKTFAQQEYRSFLYLNFEEDPKLDSLFANNLKPATILENISTYLNYDIQPEETLLIFDEIQESPSALNSLKYFQEQAAQFHIAAAGSLLGIKLANTKGFPVGKVTFMDLYPLCFFEFLEALGKNKLSDFLKQIKEFKEIPEPIHQELISLLKKYLFTGGMPEAVAEYTRSNDLSLVRKIQKDILDAYILDFAKHAPPEQLMKITQIWQSIPNQLAKENKKFIFAALGKSARGREYETAIQWLTDAGLIYKSHNISVPKLPLSHFVNNAFKVFLLDVGLLAAMSNVPSQMVVDANNLFSEFNGAFTENFVAQELVANQYQLYYWTSENIAEVDFIIEHAMEIFPLEVKSNASRKKKSLITYGNKYQPKWLLRASLMNLRKDGEICNFPLYLISRFSHLLTKK